MDELDALLADLGRRGSAPSAPAAGLVPGRVDLTELEGLMQDLAAPPKPAANTGAAAAVRPAPAPIMAPKQGAGTSSRASMSAPAAALSPSGPSVGDIDDLDALMASLGSASSMPQRRSPAYDPPPAKPLAPPTAAQPPSVPRMAFETQAPAPRPKLDVHPPAAPAAATARPPSPPSANKDADDAMAALLNNLTKQMNAIDTTDPNSKGTCASCSKAIFQEMIQALGKAYHPEHFTCGNCREPLGTRNFYESGGAPHCERCYKELFCAKCGHCGLPVLDRCVTAMGKKWHMDHFICAHCLQPFKGGQFFERDGHPYCEADFFGLFAPKCGQCSGPIRGDCVNALGQQWHPEHFVCTYCGKSFGGGTFFEHAGKPYCELHYQNQSGATCGGCGKAVADRSISALGKKWHPEHFVCGFCMSPLAGTSFSEHNGKAYCTECSRSLLI
eukprot:TRINITY_DN14559_c0_g1_i1.p1 TRINITY_DN14559_c0_g1~~TRINITY_DN14559_c0_g1_i1.p1  ORF type:complete len:444 (-),score=115.01 TRINITY_DN14559_c0_g1_i1:270-1601(-)